MVGNPLGVLDCELDGLNAGAIDGLRLGRFEVSVVKIDDVAVVVCVLVAVVVAVVTSQISKFPFLKDVMRWLRVCAPVLQDSTGCAIKLSSTHSKVPRALPGPRNSAMMMFSASTVVVHVPDPDR